MITISIHTWNDYKNLVTTKGLQPQYAETSSTWEIYAKEAELFIWKIALLKGSSDATDFENNHKSNYNQPIDGPKTDTTKAPVVAIEPAEGDFESLATHDLTSDYTAYTITPSSGKIKRIQHAEVQFTSDIVWNEPIHFDILSGGTVVDRTTYNNMKDLLSIANKGYELSGLPQFTNKVFVLPFEYARPIDLKDSQSLSMRVSFDDPNATPAPMIGEWCTITFYTVEIDE